MSSRAALAVDLFSGPGGLSLGLSRAGFFIAAAVDDDPEACATYAKNLPETRLIESDIRLVSTTDIFPDGDVPRPLLVAGCAPCQGFSSLTRKHRREDPRNALLLEMGRIVEELQPEAVFMENVPGLATYGERIFSEFLGMLDRHGYYSDWGILHLADFGVPQNRRRLVMLAGRGFFIPLPEPTHARHPSKDTRLSPWVSLREAIGDFPMPVSLRESKHCCGGPRSQDWHVVRDLQPQTVARLAAASPGHSWQSVSEELRPPCHRGSYVGFTNVYGRMSWDQLPVTITGGCTSPCKGRFGHPNPDRTTISVREAATLQTFPPDFVFDTDKIEKVCELIGNAVPPAFAMVLGERILSTMASHHESLARKI